MWGGLPLSLTSIVPPSVCMSLAESQLVVALPKVPRPSLAVLDNLGVELQPQYGVGASMLASATAIASLPSNHVSGSRIPL